MSQKGDRHWFKVLKHFDDNEASRTTFKSISTPETVKFRVWSQINQPLAIRLIVIGDEYKTFHIGTPAGKKLDAGQILPYELRYHGLLPIWKRNIFLEITGVRPGGASQTVELPVSFLSSAVSSTKHCLATSSSLEDETSEEATEVGVPEETRAESSVSVEPSSSHSQSSRGYKSKRGRAVKSQRSHYAAPHSQSRSKYCYNKPKSTRKSNRRVAKKKSASKAKNKSSRKTRL